MTATDWATIIGIFVVILGAVLVPVFIVGIKLLVKIGKLEVHMSNVEASLAAMATDKNQLWEKYGEITGTVSTHSVLIARLCDSAGISKD